MKKLFIISSLLFCCSFAFGQLNLIAPTSGGNINLVGTGNVGMGTTSPNS